MFSSVGEEVNTGTGPKKKSVLERLDDTKFKPSAESSRVGTEKSKRDLADSMRRIPVKEEMAERLSAFQPKSLVPKSWTKGTAKEKEVLKPKTEEDNKNDNIEEAKFTKPDRNSAYEFLDALKETLTGEKKAKTDDEINDEISKLIDQKRKKIREERRRGKENKENRPPQILLPQCEDLEVKDAECKKEIVKGEEKLNKMIENSKEREKVLQDRELEIQKLRERTRRMLETARKKNDQFQESEKTFHKSGDGDLNNNADLKTKRNIKTGQKSNRNTKHESKKKNAASSKEEDDKDLLAFLRQSHKNKTNIYNFIDEKKKDVNENETQKNIVDLSSTLVRKNGIQHQDHLFEQLIKQPLTPLDDATANIGIQHQENNYDQSQKQSLKNATVTNGIQHQGNNFEQLIKQSLKHLDDATANIQKTANVYENYRPRLRDTLAILPKRKHTEDRWEEAKKQNIAESNTDSLQPPSDDAAPPIGDTMPRLEVVEMEISRKVSESSVPGDLPGDEVEESDTGLSSDDPDLLHYSQRSRSVSRSPRPRRSHQQSHLLPPSPEVTARPPRPGRLSRRKSLSEDNLLAPKRREEAPSQAGVDAFGLPRISVQSRRSVSLMRDTFLSRKEATPPASQSQGRQRSISKETQTSNALEFKAKFETGKVSNLSKVSRSNSPYKPPKVDKTHLSKVKTKFNDISTDNLKLPFPNFRPKPPRPTCKPPPPPPL